MFQVINSCLQSLSLFFYYIFVLILTSNWTDNCLNLLTHGLCKYSTAKDWHRSDIARAVECADHWLSLLSKWQITVPSMYCPLLCSWCQPNNTCDDSLFPSPLTLSSLLFLSESVLFLMLVKGIACFQWLQVFVISLLVLNVIHKVCETRNQSVLLFTNVCVSSKGVWFE
jgi:hypothetical protein